MHVKAQILQNKQYSSAGKQLPSCGLCREKQEVSPWTPPLTFCTHLRLCFVSSATKASSAELLKLGWPLTCRLEPFPNIASAEPGVGCMHPTTITMGHLATPMTMGRRMPIALTIRSNPKELDSKRLCSSNTDQVLQLQDISPLCELTTLPKHSNQIVPCFLNYN